MIEVTTTTASVKFLCLIPQNTSNQTNPNCYTNLLANGRGTAGAFELSGDGSFVVHNGDHVLSPLNQPGRVVAIPAITGFQARGAQGDGLSYLDLKLSNGDFLVLNDLTRITNYGRPLRTNLTLGSTR